MTCRSDSVVMTRRSHHSLCIAAVTIVIAATGTAQAADLGDDFLRGTLAPFSSPSYQDWSGVNFGVYVGRSNQSADFGTGSSDLVAYILRNLTVEQEGRVSEWTTAGKATTSTNSYGAFLGYSYEIEPRLIAGADVTYTRFSSSSWTGYSEYTARGYETSDGYFNDIKLNTESRVRIKDYATVRGRLGYAFGQFLPYAILGVAAARVDVERMASVYLTQTDISGAGRPNLALDPNPTVKTDNRSTIAYGLVAGAGLDAMILPNVFLRAEYEFVQFAPVNGIKMNLQTGRVGVGMKF